MMKTPFKKSLVCGILIVLMLVAPTSFASTSNIKDSDKSAAGKSGLPDLIIEDIYSEYTPDITYYRLTARNIGDSDTVGDIHVKVSYIAQWKFLGMILTPIKIRNELELSLSGQGAILSPGEPHEILILRDFNHEFRNFKLSFSAEINFDHVMGESNYDNNFYDEVLGACTYQKSRVPSGPLWSLFYKAFSH